MSENVQEYMMTYSFTKLEETARTFRRLGEAYDSAAESKTESPGISKQLFLVADVLDECVIMQGSNMRIHTEELDKNSIKELTRKCLISGIRIKNVQVIKKNTDKHELVLLARTIGRGCIAVKKLVAIVSSAMKCGYYADDTNRLIVNEEYHQYVFTQEDRFRILKGIARVKKEKENMNGDNFLISHLECGKNIAAIADGMGSGKRAFIESRMVIELMENCMEAGFDERHALELVNSAYIAGGGIGNPVTVDMSIIDCQTACMSCIKLGAVSTFVKRDSWVEIIKSTTLPIGVLEQVDYDCISKKLYDGDYVVMISDGILDNMPGVNKEEQMAEIINEIKIREPNAMADEILKKSLQYNDMKASDDCTVLVLGLFDTYDN